MILCLQWRMQSSCLHPRMCLLASGAKCQPLQMHGPTSTMHMYAACSASKADRQCMHAVSMSSNRDGLHCNVTYDSLTHQQEYYHQLSRSWSTCCSPSAMAKAATHVKTWPAWDSLPVQQQQQQQCITVMHGSRHVWVACLHLCSQCTAYNAVQS